MKDSVMTMRPLPEGLAIEPGKSMTLAPGGYHMMLTELNAQLKQGNKIPAATCEFEKAGKVNVTSDVQSVGARAPASGHPGHKM
jgi:periplasmic copper chaperone A